MGIAEANVAAKPVSTFECITGSLEENAKLAAQLANRIRILVEKILGAEPQPDTTTEKLKDAVTLTDKLSGSAESLRVSLNETNIWLARLEESI